MTNKKLANAMQDLLTVSENDPAWPEICAEIGFPKLREIIMMLRYAYAAHNVGSAGGAGGSGQGTRGAGQKT
jgi:hypothetical protein